MAMATAVASTSFTSLKRSTVFGAGVQGLRAANQKIVKLAAVPSCASAKLSTTSSDGLAQHVAVGANAIAGAMLAAMVTSESAMASQEIAQLADSDARGLIIVGLLLPAIGWVLFNILRSALNQVTRCGTGA